MNRRLYKLCLDYIHAYGVLETLIACDGIDSERLTLFRVTKDRIGQLEHDMETCIVENDMLNQMTEKR